ncbi:MAG: hypothetical protein LBJ10_07910 [Clostridiales bacterium]|jgi:hypothetical protein|nr:hypothetical protein [Clostridiales bacterium]
MPKTKTPAGSGGEPWERQPGEGAKAFAAFAAYRDMGAGDRSIRKVAQNLAKSATAIKEWSARWEWQNRCAAWDAELDRLAREEQKKELLKMRGRHAQIGSALIAKAARALMAIGDGDVKAADIARMADVGAKLERLARGDVAEPDRQRLDMERERLAVERQKAEAAGGGPRMADGSDNFLDALEKLGRPLPDWEGLR